MSAMLDKAIVLAGVVLLPGCNTLSGWLPMPPPSLATEVKARDTASVFRMKGACPETTAYLTPPASGPSPQSATVLAAAGSAWVVGIAFDALNASIQKAQDNLTTSYVANGPIDIAPGTDSSKECLIIVRGRFGEDDSKKKVESGAISLSGLRRIGAVEQPSFYAEIEITRVVASSPGATDGQRSSTRKKPSIPSPQPAVARPVLVQFNDTAAPNPGWDGKKHIGILLALTPKPLTGDAAKKEADALKTEGIVGIPFNIGEMQRGTFIVSRGGDQAGGNVPADLQGNPLRNLSRVIPLAASGNDQIADAANISAFITESADPTLFDKVLAAGTKPDNTQDVRKEVAGYGVRRAGQIPALR